ncbi:MAG: hypothetical protein RMN24_10820 [Anaerolineae bacterium]|nr:hypothetical protein [Anaerolineae bacterium]
MTPQPFPIGAHNPRYRPPRARGRTRNRTGISRQRPMGRRPGGGGDEARAGSKAGEGGWEKK